MTKSMQHIVLFLFAVFLPYWLLACSPKQSIDVQETEKEIWELQLTGEVVGKLKMLLIRAKIDNDLHSITGKISGEINDYRAGTGTADYKLEGKIEAEIFKANFRGSSNMEVGTSPTSGRITGTIFKSQGSGKYSVLHAFGSSHGYYIMRKINSK